MRLIDADALMSHLKETIKKQNGKEIDLVPVGELQMFIDSEPTAYDPEKIVGQLENRSTLARPVGWTKAYEIVMLEDAIEIVKSGGIGS